MKKNCPSSQDFFSGMVLTTEAMVKRENRRCEVLLLSAERFLCIAKRYGFTYPKREFSHYASTYYTYDSEGDLIQTEDELVGTIIDLKV